MNERQNKIIETLLNYRNGRMITSESLARKMNVTTRTIKADMSVIAEEFNHNGANLIGKRNKGYTVEVFDEHRFSSFNIKVSLKSGESPDLDSRGKLRIYTARKLIAAKNGVRIDDISESINYNRSYVSEILKWSDTFFTSYNLKMKSASNMGKIVVGKEYHLRMAMVELIATHYHKIDTRDEFDEGFNNWIACDEQEKVDIRHSFLKLVRESGYSFRDSHTQRLSMYLIVAYNRFINNLRSDIPSKWVDEVKKLKLHQLTLKIFSALPERYQIMLADEKELGLFTVLMLTCLDTRTEKYDEEILALIRRELEACKSRVEVLLEDYGFELTEHEKQTLENMLVALVFSVKYGMDGSDKFNYRNESLYLSSPINLFFAYQISEELELAIGYRSNRTDLSMFGYYIQMLLYARNYPIKKQRLLSTATYGSAFGKSFDDRLMQRYPDLIESIKEVELYEYRKYENDGYDGFLVDMYFANEDNTSGDASAYNYTLPAVSTLNRMGEEIDDSIYNILLINAYQYKQFVPRNDEVKIVENYKFGSIELVFQSLSLMHAKDYDTARMLWERLEKRDNNKAMIFNDVVVICVEAKYCRDHVLEIYCLANTGVWKERKFNYIIFCSLDIDSIYRLKALETILRYVTSNNEFVLLKKDPQMCFEHIIRSNLRRINGTISL